MSGLYVNDRITSHFRQRFTSEFVYDHVTSMRTNFGHKIFPRRKEHKDNTVLLTISLKSCLRQVRVDDRDFYRFFGSQNS